MEISFNSPRVLRKFYPDLFVWASERVIFDAVLRLNSFCLMMREFALPLRDWGFLFAFCVRLGETKRFHLSLNDSMLRVFDLNQDKGVRSEAEVESSITKRGLFGGGKCSLAVELLGLGGCGVFGFAYGCPLRQDVAVGLVDSLNRDLRVLRDARQMEVEFSRGALLTGVNEIPGCDGQVSTCCSRNDQVVVRVGKTLVS